MQGKTGLLRKLDFYRSPGWKNTGMGGYQPQGLYPPKVLNGDPNGKLDTEDGDNDKWHIPSAHVVEAAEWPRVDMRAPLAKLPGLAMRGGSFPLLFALPVMNTWPDDVLLRSHSLRLPDATVTGVVRPARAFHRNRASGTACR
ncbi:hypothetical protein [Streptomyces nojiriensis]|uniref:hypothetical protein n=1 Tax=Streptomyces nojiriensis TaxID=66374 RepID=UPI0036605079